MIELRSGRIPSSGRIDESVAPIAGPIGWFVDGVCYRYPDGGDVIVSGLSTEIKPGTAVVLTGPSGSGKSTILGLLLGQLEPTSGTVDVQVDGERLGIARAAPRMLRHVGYIGADGFLVEGTLRENLFYGLDRVPTPDEIEDALARAECSFIDGFPDRLNHRLTFHGAGLSSGQKQRLALARALLRKPRALILDEATSNLDSETEWRILQTLRRLKGEVTLVIATHRPALIELGDERVDLGGRDHAPG